MPVGDAGAAKLHETQLRMPGDERADLEFGRTVEAEMRRRDLLPQQAVGAHDRRRALDVQGRGEIERNHVVAHRVEPADVAASLAVGRRRGGAPFLEEHAIAQRLRRRDFALANRQPHFEIAHPRQRIASRHVIDPRLPRSGFQHGKQKEL